MNNDDKKNKKADGINEPLELHKSFLQKNCNKNFFLLAPAANILGTSHFSIGCMKWQQDVILESI